MAGFDLNNNFTGNVFGRDRMGHVVPDLEFTETLRPYLSIPYPAPYLPTKRQDQAHPVLASVVLTSQEAVGLDANGAIVPAGLFCGSQSTKSGGGLYCALKYSSPDVGFAYNAITGNTVAAPGEVAVLACPSDGTGGDVITFPDGTTYSVTSGDVTAAKACTLFPQGVVRPIGVTIRQVFQYIGGVNVINNSGGIKFTLDGVTPLKYKVLNYMHEMGTAVSTEMVLRLPWIGTAENTLQTLANTDGLASQYTQTNYGRSFTHFIGQAALTGATPVGSGVTAVAPGARIVAARGFSAGNFTTYDSTVNDPTEVVGIVLGVRNTYPIHDYVNRVRTLYNPNRLVGPIKDPNPASLMMGGSATSGIDFIINLTTDAIFNTAYLAGTTLRPEYSTFVECAFRSF